MTIKMATNATTIKIMIIRIDLLRNYVLISKLHIPAMRLKRRANM